MDRLLAGEISVDDSERSSAFSLYAMGDPSTCALLEYTPY